MPRMIQTPNLPIDPELCKRLDHAIYQTDNPPQVAIDKANLYRSELLETIRMYNHELSEKVKTKGLYYLCCLADQVIIDHNKAEQEARSAQIHNAHTQRYSWDK